MKIMVKCDTLNTTFKSGKQFGEVYKMILGLWFAFAACGGETAAPVEKTEELSKAPAQNAEEQAKALSEEKVHPKYLVYSPLDPETLISLITD